MNWVDIVLLLIIVANVAGGWHRGFVVSFLDLVRWIGSWLLALFLYKPFSDSLGYITDWTDTWRRPIGFLIVLTLSSILIYILARGILRRTHPEIHRHPINRVLGTIPGLISGVVMAAIISALLFAMPFSDSLSSGAQDSLLAEKFAGYTDRVEEYLSPIFHPAIKQTLNKLITIEPGSDQLVELPFKVENSRPQPSLEAQMLEMINRERTSRGLKPLEADPELTLVARAHSADMFSRGYFSHYTPEGEDPFGRMKDAGVKFRAAGENLALAPTLDIAHTGLMNSPGHRANILNPAFGRVGIGIMSGGRRGIMVSQEFRN
jgi:uncharacterized protein YkwD